MGCRVADDEELQSFHTPWVGRSREGSTNKGEKIAALSVTCTKGKLYIIPQDLGFNTPDKPLLQVMLQVVSARFIIVSSTRVFVFTNHLLNEQGNILLVIFFIILLNSIR
ncbi:uncharacterized protein LOC112127441 [Cimex lectularius]|uniref:Uncharacterized protein n=1 Tax=Cimex lectularius TaxID=79782 RepID=A0A8I6TKQ7_CIMLE|nr:uncharacterized protein LOC112127441 [Cimex lectularius]